MYLIYSIIAVAVIFIIISSVLRKRIYKEVDRLEEWKNGILNRDIPEEIGKVKKLHMSGQTEEKFETWRNEWDDIVGGILPDIEERLFDIEDLAAKNRFTKAKQLIGVTEQRLNGIEEQIKELLKDVHQLVESEEQNRTEIDSVRTAYKDLSTLITKKRGSLGAGLPTIDEKLDKVNELLTAFDTATEDGSYLLARQHLVEAQSFVDNLNDLVDRYPKLLVQVDTKIPAELTELQGGIAEMEEAGYQLEAFSLESRLEHIAGELEKVKEDLKHLKYEGAEDKLTELSNQIEQLYDTLDYEVESKGYVENKIEQLSEQVEAIKEKVDLLETEMFEVQQSYFVSKEQIEAQKDMKENVVDLMNDLYVIINLADNQKQTYTSIRELVDEWQDELEKLDQSIEVEKATLYELREDERKAKETLLKLRGTMVEINRALKKSNIPGLPQRAIDQLSEAEEKLIDATNHLEQLPLELGRMNVLVEEAEELVSKNNELILQTIEQAKVAENVIQYGNRFRSKSDSVSAGLIEAELLFRQYEYEEAIECAVKVIEPYEPDVLDIVKGYVAV
ncbi:septation ring formation regulator EzrA [Halalkalibacter krulwichiae]|uniref:Septation ring formation regulator EzrA n=1 Tax=Halalkalibacter krulwichiae TaxID=199441 RepID=A0A1X9MLK0_9BACI|nr:septation ring formation regulator EzrA [Halalkalibacter krulwichiae]ARK31732.1 Septation ring formation regulator EzrA [Halalkalibacter krulwichiae]